MTFHIIDNTSLTKHISTHIQTWRKAYLFIANWAYVFQCLWVIFFFERWIDTDIFIRFNYFISSSVRIKIPLNKLCRQVDEKYKVFLPHIHQHRGSCLIFHILFINLRNLLLQNMIKHGVELRFWIQKIFYAVHEINRFPRHIHERVNFQKNLFHPPRVFRISIHLQACEVIIKV